MGWERIHALGQSVAATWWAVVDAVEGKDEGGGAQRTRGPADRYYAPMDPDMPHRSYLFRTGEYPLRSRPAGRPTPSPVGGGGVPPAGGRTPAPREGGKGPAVPPAGSARSASAVGTAGARSAFGGTVVVEERPAVRLSVDDAGPAGTLGDFGAALLVGALDAVAAFAPAVAPTPAAALR